MNQEVREYLLRVQKTGDRVLGHLSRPDLRLSQDRRRALIALHYRLVRILDLADFYPNEGTEEAA